MCLRAEGRLTFAEFMAEALHGPDGYYTRRPRLGGEAADFFTSPELHPAFGALLGQLAARVWESMGRPPQFDVVEHGPGTGVLCRDLLDWADHAAPTFASTIRYQLIETSAALREAQRDTLAAAGLLDERVTRGPAGAAPSPLPGCPPGPCAGEDEAETPSPPAATERGVGSVRPTRGLVLANELVDALPVHLVTVREGQLRERYVVQEPDGSLGWQEEAPSTPALAAYFERLQLWPGEGCLAEVNLEGVAWLERVAATLDRGALVLLDYGYPAAELYAPERRYGTLLTYRRHTLGSDPLQHVGDQDITAHVDFTSLARAGERGGLDTIGLISQSALLRRLGLDDYLQRLDRAAVPAAVHQANRRALQALTDPSGLGRIQALVQSRGLPAFDPFPGSSPSAAAVSNEARTEWLPLLRAGQMQLPGPLEAEGFLDLEEQWRELLAGVDEPDDQSP